jgi:hypothetical protein
VTLRPPGTRGLAMEPKIASPSPALAAYESHLRVLRSTTFALARPGRQPGAEQQALARNPQNRTTRLSYRSDTAIIVIIAEEVYTCQLFSRPLACSYVPATPEVGRFPEKTFQENLTRVNAFAVLADSEREQNGSSGSGDDAGGC